MTEDQLHEILSDVDIAKNAKVDLGEFLQVCLHGVVLAIVLDCSSSSSLCSRIVPWLGEGLSIPHSN